MTFLGKHHTEESRKKIREAQVGKHRRHLTKEEKQNLSRILKKKYHEDEEFMESFSQKMIECSPYHDPIKKASILEKRKIATANGAWKKTKEQREKISIGLQKTYKDPIARQHVSEGQLKMREENPDWILRNAIAVAEGKACSRHKKGHKKSKPEIIFEKFLKEEGLKYKYVGNWSFVIDSYNPDFVHERFKWIIEIYGHYWHEGKEKIDAKRIKSFKNHGYKTLVIWDYELVDLTKVRRKITKFHKTRKCVTTKRQLARKGK